MYSMQLKMMIKFLIKTARSKSVKTLKVKGYACYCEYNIEAPTNPQQPGCHGNGKAHMIEVCVLVFAVRPTAY